SDLRDESDRRGMSIIIELKRNTQPRKVLNQLYKFTPLQSTFGTQLLALVNGEPRLLTLKRALQIYIDHRLDVITRRTQFELQKARARAHILEGLLIALANLDEVIQTIRQSPDVETAKERLMSRFELSDLQAQAILDMQLRRLAALERQKIEDEHRQLMQHIDYLEDLLANPKKILSLIQEDLKDVAEKYGDERRTRIAADASGDINDEDLVTDEAVLISITERGYIKRVAAKTYRSQRRGGRGVKGHTTRDEDEVLMLLPARTLDTILFFSDRGKVYSEKAYQIPDAGRTARGIPIVNILTLGPNETITAAVPVPSFDEASYCTMATQNGRVKRVILSEFASVRPSGLIAIGLAEGDSLGWVRLTQGNEEIIIITENGQALRFSENLVRPMGRPASGVIGIRLRGKDKVVGMEVVEPDGDLLIVTTKGQGKRTSLDEYIPKGRATMGVLTLNKHAIPEVGKIAVARVVQAAEDDITLISTNGIVMRTKAKSIAQLGRATRGVRVMVLGDGDAVATMARFSAADLRRVGASEEEQNEDQKEDNNTA
ncbi:MAG: DNA gyrase C-terminal beta-propeller domain-containing protein, partial [Anaerolineales bacterium]